MLSLSRPKHFPSWWGPNLAKLQSRCAEVLESSATHYTIIALTLLDLGIVVTELILSSIFPAAEAVPHAVHTTEEVLSWCSIAILCVFTAELVAKLAVFGHRYFTSSWWHMADAVVVITSLTLELTLRGIAQEVASLLIFFRLWRILRVMHGVAEAMELNHEHELEQHHLLVHGLQKDLASQAKRIRQLEREVAALSGAAAGAGVDVSSIIRLAAAAASQPDMMLLQAQAADAAAAAAGGGGGGQAHSGGASGGGRAEEV
ncbi:hypothetical protein COHA_006064 [Chlorella ohadii]|uniref:Voltage-gated hydrogen channel 1 n=1 Tax=Chlorella ohadii TaxID=2649997 RepID=A0AAD5DME6_9CHLO|nr:hypothetical protein COHA_006064 [Chlorella ohadii]